jgi:type 1 glutamine amidotransferase
VHNRRTTH